MPPEPLPWDRKDFVFRDRRPHDRGPVDALGRGGAGGGPGSFSSPRWREPPPFRGGGPRDFRAPSPRRPPPGHYKPFLHKEPGAHGCPPPPPPPPPEEENFRCYSGRYGSSSGSGGGNSGRDGARREGRSHFQGSSPPLSSGDTPRRHHDSPLPSCAQRSVSVPQTPPASTSSSSPSHPLPLKDPHDDKTVAPVGDGPATGGHPTTPCDKDRDQDHSLGPIAWKPLKWSRSASFSSSAKPTSRSEPDDGGAAEGSELQQAGAENNPARTQLASPTPSDEGQARKKQRLGWGQGLAKYEKQKVPEDTCSGKNTLVQCTTVSVNLKDPEDTCSGKNTLVQCTTVSVNLKDPDDTCSGKNINLKGTTSDTSSKLLPLPGSASPTTPSSMNCSSSKGVEDRVWTRTASVDVASNLSDSPGHESQCVPSDFSLDLEHLDGDSLIHMNAMLAYVLQPEDTSSGDSKFTRQTAVNKIAALKSDILKALEKIEGEIDSTENELKTSSSEQDKQSKYQLEEEAIPDPVTDVKPSSPCSDSIKDLILQSSLPSTESFQEDISARQHNDRKENDIIGNGIVTVKLEAVDDTNSFTPVAKFKLLSRACYDDNKDRIWRIPSTTEDDYMCKLIPQVTSHNNTSASSASKMFNKDWLPITSPEGLSSATDSALRVKKKIVNNKRSMRVKERAIILKFRILQQLWREDMHSFFVKKQRSKSLKRSELGPRPTLNGSQKPRTSRLRLSPQGNSTPVRTRELVDLAGRLLSESGNKMYVKYSSMPCLILNESERRSLELASNNNGLVEDPVFVEKEKALINPWTDEEKKIFLENLAIHGKDFKKVASFLDHKTTADCVEFYYKNHKSDSFEPVKKILRLRKQERMEQSLQSNNYMVETGKKWKREISASSLDILGAASVIVAHSNSNVRVRPKVSNRPIQGSQCVLKTSSDSKARTRITESPAEAAAANVLAGISSTISSEGISCITSSVDPCERVECPVFSEVTQTIDEETCSDEGFGELRSGDWTDGEKSLFINAVRLFGRDFARISHYLGTRSKEQCKIFFSKARKCLGLDGLSQGGGNGETPSSDANCGRSDLDDACLAEMDSAVCSIQSCSKVDTDLAGSIDKVTNHGTTLNMGHDTGQGKSNEDVDVGPSKEEFEPMLEAHQPLVIFKHNDINLSKENEDTQNEKIPDVDKQPIVPVECKSTSECANGLKANGADLIAKVEPFCVVTSAPVKHEIINPQCEDARRSSFDNCSNVKLEAESLAEPVALKSVDMNGLPPIGVPSVTKPPLDSNGNVACLVKNDESSTPNVLAPVPENQIELNLPPLPLMNTEMVPSRKQLGASVLSVDLSVNTFPSICLEGHPVAPLGNLSCEVSRSHTPCDKDVEKNKHFINIEQPMVRPDQSSSILSGFPLQTFNRGKAVDDSGFFSPKSVEVEGMQKKSGDGGVRNLLFRKDISGGDKSCGNIASSDVKPAIHFMPADALLRQCSQGLCSDVEEPPPVRTGDVKLFGKILSHPPPVQKLEEPEVKPSTSTPANDIKHLSVELASSRNSSRVLHQTNMDTTHFGLAELPMRSYGFWDGQRIRTGFSALPENAVLLSKYPEVLSGMTYYQNKDSVNTSTSNNCFVIHQQQQPFSVDEKGQNVITELPKLNGIETVPGRVAMRVGGNVLVAGGVCTAAGISDPVAALKMHYSRQNELLGGGSGSKEDSWSGDLAGR